MRLPVPTDPNIREFQALFECEYGVCLDYTEARDRLTHLVQFYFLTKGHELYAHNERVTRNDIQSENPQNHTKHDRNDLDAAIE